MTASVWLKLGHRFLGHSPTWYKKTIIIFLLINPLVYLLAGSQTCAWFILGEFIFTLAMALEAFPLQPGGLLLIEALFLGLTTPESLNQEVTNNFSVLLLLIFMVTAIHFLRDLLMIIFSKILTVTQSQAILALLFTISAAVLSAFLDALTVTAVVITVATGFHGLINQAKQANDVSEQDFQTFRDFLCGLMMHSAVGTALGGVFTLIGEPQNLLIGYQMGWNFKEFIIHMAPVSLPVLLLGLLTCLCLERFGVFGYGIKMPVSVKARLNKATPQELTGNYDIDTMTLLIQAFSAIVLIIALSLHVAEIGFIGLMVIILATTLNGNNKEEQLAIAFRDSMPFTALLVVFFGIVAMLHEQHLFSPLIAWVHSLPEEIQASTMFAVNGILSSISDNVFVATLYIEETRAAFDRGLLSRGAFEQLAIAINAGTNLPSVATPNGQAAFLFLLTSALAPMIGLTYGRMVWMALPYTIVLTISGLACTALFI
ncbi:MAG: sodium/proton antiporter NhaB [Endozoicomonadaceae bacterium]|nr:sodium/proton antiporter NhaB [Endozoicomonadaceae bacterium]